jgi:formylglycine-generating enzyme required for sulfatase activity
MGLYGNAWEWCGSRVEPAVRSIADRADAWPEVKDKDDFILRGGSFWEQTINSYLGAYAFHTPASGNLPDGFRIAS